MCAFALSTKKNNKTKAACSSLLKNLLTRLVENPPNIYRKTVGYIHAVVFVELLKCHNSILFALPLDNFNIIVFVIHTVDRF
jgi:hypothetical protein